MLMRAVKTLNLIQKTEERENCYKIIDELIRVMRLRDKCASHPKQFDCLQGITRKQVLINLQKSLDSGELERMFSLDDKATAKSKNCGNQKRPAITLKSIDDALSDSEDVNNEKTTDNNESFDDDNEGCPLMLKPTPPPEINTTDTSNSRRDQGRGRGRSNRGGRGGRGRGRSGRGGRGRGGRGGHAKLGDEQSSTASTLHNGTLSSSNFGKTFMDTYTMHVNSFFNDM